MTTHFTLPERTAKLFFTGIYEGAEVQVLLDIPLGDFVGYLRLEDETTFDTLPEKYKAWVNMGILKSWNLHDKNGNPIPITEDCMSKIPTNFAQAIMRAWFKAVTELPDPLEENSSDGEMSEAELTV